MQVRQHTAMAVHGLPTSHRQSRPQICARTRPRTLSVDRRAGALAGHNQNMRLKGLSQPQMTADASTLSAQ